MFGDGPVADSGPGLPLSVRRIELGPQPQVLGIHDGDLGDQFGVSVGVRGTYIITGADFHNSAEGAAYVFGRCP